MIFTPFEPNRRAAACRCGCGFATMDYGLVGILQVIASEFNTDRVIVTSWCRCPEYNAKVGGARKSQHLYGRAADIKLEEVAPERIAQFLDETYPDELGVGLYKTFVHVDSREKKARWQKS